MCSDLCSTNALYPNLIFYSQPLEEGTLRAGLVILQRLGYGKSVNVDK